MNQINLPLLTQVTGDPFADTGAWALEVFQKEHPDENILQLIERATKIYVNQWDAIWNTFSRDAVAGGSLESLLARLKKVRAGRRVRGVDRMLFDLRDRARRSRFPGALGRLSFAIRC